MNNYHVMIILALEMCLAHLVTELDKINFNFIIIFLLFVTLLTLTLNLSFEQGFHGLKVMFTTLY